MKTQAKIILAFGLIILFVYACKKDKKTEQPEPVNVVSGMLKAHSWKYNETFFLNRSGVLYGYYMPACVLDDKLDYLGNDNYVKDPGSDLCNGQVQKKDTLGWKLTDNNTRLEINNKGTVVKNDIIRISADSLMTSFLTPAGDTQVYLFLKY